MCPTVDDGARDNRVYNVNNQDVEDDDDDEIEIELEVISDERFIWMVAQILALKDE